MHLVDFTIRNFKSYKEETLFTFEALEDDFMSGNFFTVPLSDGSEMRLLKSAALYGANAAGKSNIVWALKALVYMVRASRNFPVGFKIPFEPFRSGDKNIPDTYFSIRFIVEGRMYRYSISYNAERFSSEQLTVLCSGKEKKILAKDGDNFSFGEGWESPSLDLSDVKFLANHLLLSELAVKPQNNLQQLYSAIAGMIAEPVMNNFNLRAKNINVGRDILKERDSVIFKRLNNLMHIADFGIVGLEMNRHDDEDFHIPDSIPEAVKNQFIDDNRWEFKTLHRTKDNGMISFPLEDESTGTQNMFSLGSIVLQVLSQGGFLAYDEMDIAVHPQLFKLLVTLFHTPEANPYNAQILFTTHNTIIVNETEGIMRADQVWFAEKDEYGESTLFSAQDFEGISIVVPFERWYRNGRFGALPNIGDISKLFQQQ